MNTLFISDLHLSERNTHLNALFDQFIQDTLEKKDTIDALYILGDFFDVWLGDDITGEWEEHIALKLAKLNKAGIPVYFMHGNRDFLLGKTFIQSAQCTFLKDPTLIDLYGKRIILKHGDDLCTEDRQYQLFRAIVRSAWIKRLYLALPILWRKQIAVRIRQKSANRGMRDIYAKVSTSLVEKLFQEKSADILIHGHTHCPQIKTIAHRMHIILSDWNTRGNLLVMNSKGEFSLDYFE